MEKEKTLTQKNIHQTQKTKTRVLRNHQDTIFSSLYSDPECVLDLYLTLHPEDQNRGITPDQVKLITLENVFLAQIHNDVAFQIEDRLIVLVEHQSTINENMPLRMLFYVADEYKKIISSFKKKLYREKRITIPKPEFYIVYTGQMPWNQELKLSDAYDKAPLDDIVLELKVQIIHEEDMRTTQNTLGSYYDFVSFVKNNTVDGKIRTDAVKKYIHHFAGSKLFKKYLEKLSAEEVINMTNYEFDLEEAKEVWKEEAMEEGLEKGLEKGMEKGIRSLMENLKFSLNQAMDALSIPAEQQPMYAERILKK